MMWHLCSVGTLRPLKLCVPRAASFNRNSDFGDQQTTTTYVLRLYTALPAALQSAFHCAKLFRGTPHGSPALNRGRNWGLFVATLQHRCSQSSSWRTISAFGINRQLKIKTDISQIFRCKKRHSVWTIMLFWKALIQKVWYSTSNKTNYAVEPKYMLALCLARDLDHLCWLYWNQICWLSIKALFEQ